MARRDMYANFAQPWRQHVSERACGRWIGQHRKQIEREKRSVVVYAPVGVTRHFRTYRIWEQWIPQCWTGSWTVNRPELCWHTCQSWCSDTSRREGDQCWHGADSSSSLADKPLHISSMYSDLIKSAKYARQYMLHAIYVGSRDVKFVFFPNSNFDL